MRIRRLLLLAGLIGSALMASGQDSRMSDRSKEVFKGAVEVSVSRDKHSYKQGEPIWHGSDQKRRRGLGFCFSPNQF